MEHDILGRPSGKFPGATEHIFFQTECSKRKFVFHIFKAIFDTSFRLRGRFLVVEMLCTNSKRDSRMKLPVLNFAHHLPKP